MDDHYFSADPSVAFKRQPVVADVWGHRLALTSGSGVFAQGRLDVGTAVLFRETEPPRAGSYLDLGCGYGVIGLALARAVPGARVRAVDVNERAVLLANENAAALGVADRFAACTPDDVPAGEVYEEIWSNPPIRIGKEALHALLLRGCRGWRPAGGRCWSSGKNLGADSLQRWLGEQGWPTDAAGQREGLPGAGDQARVSDAGQPSRPSRSAARTEPGAAPSRASRPAVPPQQLVGRGGHAVQPAEQHDLAVEVVGLDAALRPAQALPGRARRRAGGRPARGAAGGRRAGRGPRSGTPRSSPLAASARSPSAPTTSSSRSASGSSLPQHAWTALPRFIISLRRFHAMMSARGSETKPAARERLGHPVRRRR